MDFSIITLPASIITLSVTVSWLIFLWSSFRFKMTPLADHVNDHFFSVVIPAHNEERVIAPQVRDFLNQTYDKFEVIVVCHNCTDETETVLQEIADKRLKIISLKTERSGKALAMNAGLKKATGDIIVQMDADNHVDEHFLGKANAIFQNPEIKVVQSTISTKNANFNLITKCQQMEYNLFGTSFWEGRMALRQSCTIGGTGVLFRKSVLDKIGGWDNELIEDYDIYCKIAKTNTKIYYRSDIECFDEKPVTWSAVIRQRSRWIRGHMEVAKKRFLERLSLADGIYMIAPFFYPAWYASSLLAILFFVGEYVGFSVTFFYLPSYTWLTAAVLMYGFFVVRLVKTRHAKDIVYLPIFYVFSFHWLIAFLKSLTVTSWKDTKTQHGN